MSIVKGKLELLFTDDESYNTFQSIVELMTVAGALPKDFGWHWRGTRQKEGGWRVEFFKEPILPKCINPKCLEANMVRVREIVDLPRKQLWQCLECKYEVREG